MKTKILYLLLLSLVSALPDTFHFSQCECPDFKFSSQEKNNFLNPLVRVGNPELFSCPGQGKFPEENGVILDNTDPESKLTTTVSTDLFQDNIARRRKFWHAAFRVSFKPVVGAEFSLFEILHSSIVLFDAEVKVLSLYGISVVVIFSGGKPLLGIDLMFAADVTLDVVIGTASNTKSENFYFVCASMNGNEYGCRTTNLYNNGFFPSTTARLNLVKPLAYSKPMPVKFSMAHFDDGATNGITVTGEGNKELQLENALAEIAREIVAGIPEVILLPILDKSKSFTTNEDAEHTINFFDVLKGGTLSSNDLSFEIVSNPNRGFIRTDGSSEFNYIPNRGFNGKDTFSFTYSVNSPFQCNNTVTSDIIVLPKQPPVAQNFKFDVLPTIGREISVEVATDVDEIDGKMDGTLTFDNTIPGILSKMCESSVSITELLVKHGSVSFCYTPDEMMIDGVSEILEFTVTDETNLKDKGSFVFNGIAHPPVAQNFEFDVFATIGREISVEVATDVDHIDGKMDGTLTLDNAISGVISSSCESSIPITEFPVVNGSVSFCYIPDETMIDVASQALEFTVTDETNLKDKGYFIFKGNNPFFVADENPVEIGNIGAPLTFFLGRDRFGKKAPGVPKDALIGIRVTKLPEAAHGILKDSKGNNVDLNKNSIFLSNENLTFVPARGVFNAGNKFPFDAAGNLISNCSKSVDNNRTEGRCPISFEYDVFPGGVEMNSTEVFFIINAVEDENPQITVKGKKQGIYELTSVSNVTVTSDSADIFQVKMQISSSKGLEFKIKIPTNPVGFELVDGIKHDASLVNCTLDSCGFVNLLGVPSQLEEVANNLKIDNLPKDGFPLINFEVVSSSGTFGSGDSIRLHFRSEESAPAFYPGGIIGGTVGGILILAIIVGLGVYHSEKTGRDATASLLARLGKPTESDEDGTLENDL